MPPKTEPPPPPPPPEEELDVEKPLLPLRKPELEELEDDDELEPERLLPPLKEEPPPGRAMASRGEAVAPARARRSAAASGRWRRRLKAP